MSLLRKWTVVPELMEGWQYTVGAGIEGTVFFSLKQRNVVKIRERIKRIYD